ncbi:MAG: hypothetical protein AAF600_13075 [Bacteroidota bacterium]
MKRYVVTMDFYVYADSDVEAVDQAKKYADDFDSAKDNRANVISVHENPFASTVSRLIEI